MAIEQRLMLCLVCQIFYVSFKYSILNTTRETFISLLRIKSLIFIIWALLAQTVKNLPAMPETVIRSLGWEDHLEK